jgi:hypothetical protein
LVILTMLLWMNQRSNQSTIVRLPDDFGERVAVLHETALT